MGASIMKSSDVIHATQNHCLLKRCFRERSDYKHKNTVFYEIHGRNGEVVVSFDKLSAFQLSFRTVISHLGQGIYSRMPYVKLKPILTYPTC